MSRMTSSPARSGWRKWTVFELPDPLVQVLEEGAVQFGLLDFILGAAQHIVEVTALGMAFQQLGKGQ